MPGVVIRNGTIVTALDQYVADVYCDGGLITAIGPDLVVPADSEVIDASGQYVFPGGIDAHTHMELPFMGTVSADDFYTGTAAGVAGGTTTILDFIIPSRNQSLIEARDFWMNNAKKAVADYGFHMAVTWYGEQVEQEMRRVHAEDGISSFKVFMAYTGAIGVDDDEMIGVIDTAASLGALVTAHCEHGLAVQALQRKLIAQGKTAPKYHAESRPSWVEGEATNRAIMIADMAVALEATRALCHKAAWMVDQGRLDSIVSSMAKLYSADMAMKVATDAVQVFGGYGYTKEYPVEKLMRDAKLLQIYEGTSQIQRMVIAKNILSGDGQ